LGAITILKDHINIPKGYNILFINNIFQNIIKILCCIRGILTPASAFRKTQFVNRLMDHDAAVFEIESDLIIYGQQSNLI